jgi:hypothetical protein
MAHSNLYDFFRKMDQDGVILSYKGIISPELITSILNIMESKMQVVEDNLRIRKKVYNVLVEILQNLYHHVDAIPDSFNETQSDNRVVMVIISKDDTFYTVQTGNYIDNSKVNSLLKRIDTINELDVNGLKEMYQQQLNSAVISDKGTAGLGMIDIVRKSGNKLEYLILPVGSANSFFCLTININAI